MGQAFRWIYIAGLQKPRAIIAGCRYFALFPPFFNANIEYTLKAVLGVASKSALSQ